MSKWSPLGTLSIKVAAKGAQSSVKDAVWEDWEVPPRGLNETSLQMGFEP